MPHCIHCDGKFTRVEALKKHVKGSCPFLHSRPVEQVPESGRLKIDTQSSACGAGDCEGPLGHACRAPPAPLPGNTVMPETADTPLMQRQNFRDSSDWAGAQFSLNQTF